MALTMSVFQQVFPSKSGVSEIVVPSKRKQVVLAAGQKSTGSSCCRFALQSCKSVVPKLELGQVFPTSQLRQRHFVNAYISPFPEKYPSNS